MQDKHLFEYAIIRVVPRVERGEFLNVGVILYCAAQKFLQAQYNINNHRLTIFSKDIDSMELKDRLLAFHNVCCGTEDGGPIGKLPIASRFRWLTATRSTIVQTSPVHPGLCKDANHELQKLFDQLVM